MWLVWFVTKMWITGLSYKCNRDVNGNYWAMTDPQVLQFSGVDPRFLERGFICIKVWGLLCWFYLIFLKYPMKLNWFSLTETKLFHFHRTFKDGGQRGWGTCEPPESPLDPPLILHFLLYKYRSFIISPHKHAGYAAILNAILKTKLVFHSTKTTFLIAQNTRQLINILLLFYSDYSPKRCFGRLEMQFWYKLVMPWSPPTRCGKLRIFWILYCLYFLYFTQQILAKYIWAGKQDFGTYPWADLESFVRGGPTFFLVHGGREDPDTNISGLSMAPRQTPLMAFCWRADDGPTLYSGLVALWFFRRSRPVLLRSPKFKWFFCGGGGVRTPCPPPLDWRMR